MNVKNDVTLNMNELDKEWERQSSLMEEYASALASANREYANMDVVLKGMIAERKMEWRLKGEITVGGKSTKLTEGALDNAVDSDGEIISQRRMMIDKQYEIDSLKGIVEALRNKKSALEYEVQLYLSGYFSSPKDQRELIKNKQR
jgi:hypothetical protein